MKVLANFLEGLIGAIQGSHIWAGFLTFLEIVQWREVALGVVVTGFGLFFARKIWVSDLRRPIAVLFSGLLAIGCIVVFGLADWQVSPHPAFGQGDPRDQRCLLPPDDLIHQARDAGKRGALVIFSGPSVGAYHPHAKEIAAEGLKLDVRIEVKETDGSEKNADWVSSKDNPGTWVGLSQPELVANDSRFQDLPVGLFVEKLHVVVGDDSRIRAFSELQSKNIAVIGSGSLRTLKDLLRAAGVVANPTLMKPKDAEQAFNRRQADALVYFVEERRDLFSRLKKPRFLPIVIDDLLKKDDPRRNIYLQTVLRKDAYPWMKELTIPTLGGRPVLFARKDSDPCIMAFYKTLIEDSHLFAHLVASAAGRGAIAMGL